LTTLTFHIITLGHHYQNLLSSSYITWPVGRGAGWYISLIPDCCATQSSHGGRRRRDGLMQHDLLFFFNFWGLLPIPQPKILSILHFFKISGAFAHFLILWPIALPFFFFLEFWVLGHCPLTDYIRFIKPTKKIICFDFFLWCFLHGGY